MPCVPNKTHPSFLDKLTFIERFIFSPCTTPWVVYMKTGGRALGNAALSIVGTSWDDVARELFRPKGPRALAHGGEWKRNRRRGSAKPLLQDTAELVGEGVELFTEWKRPDWSDTSNHLWRLDGFAQHQLYKVMVVNIAGDFAYDWYSGILSNPDSHCSQPRFVASGRPIGGHAWGFYGARYNWEFEDRVGITAYSYGYFVPAGTWQVLWTVDAFNVSATQWNDAAVRIMVGDPQNPTPCHGPVNQQIPQGKTVTLAAEGIVQGPEVIMFAVTTAPPFNCGYQNFRPSILSLG